MVFLTLRLTTGRPHKLRIIEELEKINPQNTLLDSFFTDVCSWCARNKDIFGLALVGSYARRSDKENSDVDLIIITKQPELLLENQSWAHTFGKIKSIRKENYGKVVSLHTAYMHLPEIEFGITDLSWVDLPLDDGTKKVILDGIRVIYDPLGLLQQAVDTTRQGCST